jgi:ubiquitin C-terminal hydrolase
MFRNFDEFLRRVRLEDVDATSFVNCIASLIEVPKSLSDQHFGQDLFAGVLTIASDFVNAEDSGRQLFGARLFKVFASQDACPTASELFKTRCKSGAIVKRLSSPDVSPHVLLSLGRLVLDIARDGELTGEQIMAIWKASQTSDERDEFLDFCLAIFKVLSLDDLVGALSQIAETCAVDLISITIKVIRARVAERELATEVLKHLLHWNHFDWNYDELKELCGRQISSEQRKMNLRVCKEILEGQYSLPCVRMLTFLADAAYSLKADFDGPMMQVLLRRFCEAENTSEFFELFHILVRQKAIVVNDNMANKLWMLRSWQFLQDVIGAMGMKGFNCTALQVLNNCLDSDKAVIVTPCYAQFLCDLVCLLNVPNGKCNLGWRSEFIICKLPLDSDDHLFAILVNPPTKEVFELVQKNLLNIYAKNDKREAAIMNLLKKIKAAQHDKETAALLNFVSDICHKLEDATKELPFERHGTIKDFSGTFCVRVQFPEIGAFSLSLNNSLRISTVLLGLSPWLREDSSRFCLQSRERTLSDHPTLSFSSICADRELRVVESRGTVKAAQALLPSQILIHEDFVKDLLNMLIAPHSDEFHRACQKLLDYLSSDQAIKNSSANPEPFLGELRRIGNEQTLSYHLRILRWRIQCPFYLNQYKDAGLADLLRNFLQTAPTSAGVIVDVLDAISGSVYSDFLEHLLSALANPAFPIDSGVAVSKYLTKRFDAGVVLNVQLIEKALLKMEPPVWDEFSEFLWKNADIKELYELSVQHLDNQHFRDIFTHFVAVQNDDAQCRFTLCLELLQKGFWDGTASALTRLVSVNASSLLDSPDLIRRLLQILKKSDVSDSATVYDLLAQLSKLSPAYARDIDGFIDELMAFEMDRWSLSQVEPNFQGLCGLRNLGATCYHNSVFQQILRIPAFQYLLLAEDCPEESSLHALQVLLHYMLHSKRRFCETLQFCQTWHGWDNEHVNVREQQDANEFFQLLIDQMPASLKSLFCGKLVNSIDGEGVHQEINENFLSLGLTVKNIGDLRRALDVMADPEVLEGDNQYVAEDGRRINATRQQRLIQLPPVLVFQLKRFEYHSRTQPGAKLNSRFEFPGYLDMMNARFVLNGVVLHTGEVNAGHYTSFMQIHEKWVKFNDMEVVEIEQSQFEEESFGGGQDARASADLLFYVNPDATVSGNKIMGSFELRFDPQIMDLIGKNNDRFLLEQHAFSEHVAKFVLTHAKWPQLRDFYFNVLCHSRLANLALDFGKQLEKVFDGDFIDWLIANFSSKVVPVYVNCSIAEIVQSLTTIIKKVTAKGPIPKAFQLIDRVVRHLRTCGASWRQVPEISKLIRDFLNPETVELGREHHWIETLSSFIYACFGESRGDVFLQNIDITRILDSMAMLLTERDRQFVQGIPALFTSMSKSKCHIRALKNYLVKAAELGLYELKPIFALIPHEFTSTKLLEIEVGQMTNENFRESILRLKADSKIQLYSLVSALTKAEPVLHSTLVENCDILLDWLGSSATAESITSLITLICQTESDATQVFERMKRRASEGSRLQSPFLKLLLWVLHKTKHSHDDLLEGFEKQPISDDVIFVHAYFGSKQFLTHFEDRLKERRPYNCYSADTMKILNGFIPVLGMIPDTLFVKVMESSLWASILATAAKVTSESDFKTVDALIVVMVERQKLSQAAHSVLVQLITNHSSSRYIARFAARLADVTDLSSDDLSKVILTFHSSFTYPSVPEIKPITAAYVPRILSAVKQFPDVRLELDVVKAIKITCQRLDADTMRLVVDYLLLVMKMKPTFQCEMTNQIKASIARRAPFTANSVSILLLDWLALADRTRGEGAIWKELELNHELFLAMDADDYQGELWKLYGRGIADSLTETWKGFLVQAFAKAKVAVPEEKEFFAIALKRLEEPDVEHIIEDTCTCVNKCEIHRPAAALPAARRVLLLAVDVWPERKAEIVGNVAPEIVAVFPKGVKNWAEVTALFNP